MFKILKEAFLFNPIRGGLEVRSFFLLFDYNVIYSQIKLKQAATMYSETTGVQVPDIFIKGDKIFFKNLLSSTNSFTLLWRSSATLDIL